jgi:hypothetical protein
LAAAIAIAWARGPEDVTAASVSGVSVMSVMIVRISSYVR